MTHLRSIFGIVFICMSYLTFGQSPMFINLKPFQLDLSPMIETERLRQQLHHEMTVEDANRRAREIQSRIHQVNNYYASTSSSHPNSITDGWHEAWATNNNDICEVVKVWVQENKVGKLFANDYNQMAISSATSINSARCMLQIEGMDFFDLYFLAAISDPNERASPPLKPGSISIYGEKHRPTSVYLDGEYVGTLDTFPRETPNCYGDGTIDLDLRPGTHKIVAEAGSKRWTTTVNVIEADCVVVKVTSR